MNTAQKWKQFERRVMNTYCFLFGVAMGMTLTGLTIYLLEF